MNWHMAVTMKEFCPLGRPGTLSWFGPKGPDNSRKSMAEKGGLRMQNTSRVYIKIRGTRANDFKSELGRATLCSIKILEPTENICHLVHFHLSRDRPTASIRRRSEDHEIWRVSTDAGSGEGLPPLMSALLSSISRYKVFYPLFLVGTTHRMVRN
jgi:hypothetical protein